MGLQLPARCSREGMDLAVTVWCRSRLRRSGLEYPHLTRVMSFSRDKSTDRLWRQGIDLIGDKRGCDVGESIEDGAMLGKSEGREFLDVTDNGFDDVAPIEQSLVEERHR